MSNNRDDIKKAVADLCRDGRYLLGKIAIETNQLEASPEVKDLFLQDSGYEQFVNKHPVSGRFYQNWFTQSSRVVKSVIPERHTEFILLYRPLKPSTKTLDFLTFTISDYFMGVRVTETKGWHYHDMEKVEVFSSYKAFAAKFNTQLDILRSCLNIIDSKLGDIEGALQYKFFENELQAAKDLLKKKYNRASAALAGVTLEIHLAKVCINHQITFRSNNPTISKYNEALKNEDVVDTPTWRLIQRLGDIRNLAVHSKDREPTSDEVEDLIRGCEKLIAELN